MNAFEHAVRFVLEQEGGLANLEGDPGGVTNYGISIRFAGSIGLDLNGDGETTGADILALTEDIAINLYRDHFWRRSRCDLLPPAIAVCVFDAAVNQGPGTAARMLQRILGTAADGVIGPVTSRLAHKTGLDLVTEYDALRADRYARTRNYARFGRGWQRRRAKCTKFARKIEQQIKEG